MRKHILLAGPSGAGKSTLAAAIGSHQEFAVVSTSKLLRDAYRKQGGAAEPTKEELFTFGNKLPVSWLADEVRETYQNVGIPSVVDAIRGSGQTIFFNNDQVVRVNVVAAPMDRLHRVVARGHVLPSHHEFEFDRPDFTWDSTRVSLATAVKLITELAMGGGGSVDVVLGGQWGSEGKGKVCALLANRYDALVRSGGPNAGHWVRTPEWEYCYHHLPSGTRSNPRARILLAAGMNYNPVRLNEEITETDCQERVFIDRNAVEITETDRFREIAELVDGVGSTAQGVGAAQARRVMRGVLGEVFHPDRSDDRTISVSDDIDDLLFHGKQVMIEGTQGSGLSLYHGPYPFTTSRDTNVGGLLAECGVAPSRVRDVWMVVRSFPIRVAGNSGPMPAGELTWEQVAGGDATAGEALRKLEKTSTTKRDRRVGNFDFQQVSQAIALNRPTRLVLTFADYLDSKAAGCREWTELPRAVHAFAARLEQSYGVPVAGVSTGRMQADFAWKGGF